MNTKRTIFWSSFIIVLVLIVWGLIVAMNKPVNPDKFSIKSPATITATDHIRGSANAPVTIIEYSDFQCPACASYFPLVERLMNEASTSTRFVYRHFPLSQHQNAIPAAQASEAADRQGKFWDMYSLIFTNQDIWKDSENAKSIFEGYAEQIGLNMTLFKKDYDDTEIKARIRSNSDEGMAIGINATPTFFVNGKAIVNPQSYEAFKALIEAAATGN